MVMSAPIYDIYRPRGGARRLMECRDPRILMDGPAGTGKTSAILHKIVARAEKYPNYRAWIGRQFRSSMSQSVLVTLETKVLPAGHPALTKVRREYRHSYQFPNGSEIVVGGLDTPSVTFSAEYDDMAVFEAIETDQDSVESLLRALRNGKTPYHQLVTDTNPGPNTHWLNRQGDNGWFNRILSRHEDNPLLWDDDKGCWTEFGVQYIAALDALTGHRKQRLRHGRWVAAEGVVYPEFDASIHVIDAMPQGWESWPKYRAIDLGYVDPFVCQWWAVSGEAMYMYREVYMSNRLIEDHARQIVQLSQGEEYYATVSDHDREDRETLHRHGVETTPASKDIDAGIAVMRGRLAKGGNGKPRMYFLRGALVERDQVLADAKRPTSTVEEFDAYLWKNHRDGVHKDEPVDRDNHGMDTARYAAMSLEGGDFYFFSVGSEEKRGGNWRDGL